MRFRIETPFGVVPFAECDLRFTARIGYDGTVALDRIGAIGLTPCGDLRSCRRRQNDREGQPWLGEVAPHGRASFHLRIHACMDTCAGWFEGPLELILRRVGGGWNGRAERAQVGYTGLEVDGAGRLRGRDLRLRSDKAS